MAGAPFALSSMAVVCFMNDGRGAICALIHAVALFKSGRGAICALIPAVVLFCERWGASCALISIVALSRVAGAPFALISMPQRYNIVQRHWAACRLFCALHSCMLPGYPFHTHGTCMHYMVRPRYGFAPFDTLLLMASLCQ